MRRWLSGGSAALVFLVTLPAVAQDSDSVDTAAPGFFVGMDASYTHDFAGPEGAKKAGGFTLRAGYRPSRFFALEGQFENPTGFGEVDGSRLESVDPLVFSVNARGYLPFGDFHPYALVGGGLWSPSFMDSRGLLKVGGGLDYWLTDNLSTGLNIIYSLPFAGSGEPDFDYLSVGWGLQYTFRFAGENDL